MNTHTKPAALKAGKQAEQLFVTWFSEYIPVKPAFDREFDFYLSRIYPPTGNRKVDAKGDTYDSGTMFVERYGHFDKKRIGGPWRAMEVGADYIHIFPFVAETPIPLG